MSQNNLLTLENIVSSPIAEGDAGVILKADGSWNVFSTSKLGETGLSPAQMEQGKKLIALSVALKHPQIMEILMQMANDPALVGDTVDVGTLN